MTQVSQLLACVIKKQPIFKNYGVAVLNPLLQLPNTVGIKVITVGIVVGHLISSQTVQLGGR